MISPEYFVVLLKYKVNCIFCLKYDKWKKNSAKTTSNQPLMLQCANPTANQYNLAHAWQEELVNAIVDDLLL